MGKDAIERLSSEDLNRGWLKNKVPFLSTFPSCLTTDLSLLRHQVLHVAKQSIGDLPKTPRMYSPMWCCGVAYARHVKRPRGGWRQCIFFRRPQGRRFLLLLVAWPTWLACTIDGFFRLVESSCRPHGTVVWIKSIYEYINTYIL